MHKIFLLTSLVLTQILSSCFAGEIEHHKVQVSKKILTESSYSVVELQGETQGRNVLIRSSKSLGPEIKIQSRTNARYFLTVVPNKMQSKEILAVTNQKEKKNQNCEMNYTINIKQEKEANLESLEIRCI